jgi:hypothetical protein
MFKKLLFLVFFLLLLVPSKAQTKRFSKDANKPKPLANIYLGLGTGINNYSGLFGLEAEIPVLPKLSILGTVGVGGWGYKAGVGVQYYLTRPQFGGAFSAGFSNAFGATGIDLELESGDSKTMTLFNAGTINIAYAYHFHLGQRSKFVLGAGWAIPTVNSPWEVISPPGSELNPDEVQLLEILQPGGLLLSMKLLFGP